MVETAAKPISPGISGDLACPSTPLQALDAPPAEQWEVLAAEARSLHDVSTSRGQPLGASGWDVQVMRSTQIDAQRLDNELMTMLQEQFAQVFVYLRPGLLASIEPELHVALTGLVYLLTVWRGGSTPGSQLLNLRYRDERAMSSLGMQLDGRSGVEGPVPSTIQRCFYGIGYVVLPYLWSRANRAAAQLEWEERVALMSGPPATMPRVQHQHQQQQQQQQQQGLSWLLRLIPWSRIDVARLARGAMRRAEAAHHLAVLLNLVAFLRTGTFRSVLERACGMRLVYQEARMTRVISFEYLNRQLVWQELSEVLLFLLPLVDVVKVRRALSSYLPRLPSPTALLSSFSVREGALTSLASETTTPEGLSGKPGAAERASNVCMPPPEVLCPICGSTDVILPFQALPCRHVFCYYCLRANCAADEGFTCPLDGVRVSEMRWLSLAAPRQQ